MTPFEVPDGPFTIEGIMEAIETQIVRREAVPTPTPPPSGEETATRAPAAATSVIPAPLVVDGSASSRVQAQLDLARQRQSLDPGYRIHSHRRVIGWAVNAIKRVIHWGSHPYADAIRQRQELFNETALQALRELSLQADAIERRLEEVASNAAALSGDAAAQRRALTSHAGRLGGLEKRANEAAATLDRLCARHDLGPFYSRVAPERRMAALDESRGTYEDVATRQALYVELFRGAPGQVLDVGCGRGELLAQLRRAGIECWGAEVDPLMVDLTRRAGIHTRRMDALEALRSTPPASLGGLFAAQVVEHFFPGELLEFLVLARRRLAPGGRIVLETLNPASLGVMAKSYWRDLDHKQAIHPDALRMLVELAGFAAVETRYLAPFGDDERLPELPPAAEGGLSPEARAVLQDRFDRINAALYGMQDYYVTGLQATPLGDGAGERLAPVDPAAAGGCGS